MRRWTFFITAMTLAALLASCSVTRHIPQDGFIFLIIYYYFTYIFIIFYKIRPKYSNIFPFINIIYYIYF